jgi:hypothetical protein
MLLVKEMHHAIAYGCWKADWWQCQTELQSQLDPILGGADACLPEGLHAYAAEHTYQELSPVSQLENNFQYIQGHVRMVLGQWFSH